MKTLRYLLVLFASAGLLVACAEEEVRVTLPDVEDPADNGDVDYEVNFMGDFVFPGDWGEVPVSEVITFYPGTVSLDFLEDETLHAGAGQVGVMACSQCHNDDALKGFGDSLVEGGRQPWIEVAVQAAYDSDNIYMKFEWDAPEPGLHHDYLQWDGDNWERMRFSEDRLAIIIDDSDVEAYDDAGYGFATVGCFQSCHDNLNGMPNRDDAPADWIDDGGDVRKRLLLAHEGPDHESAKSSAEIDALMAEGSFLDLWQWRGGRSAAIQTADDASVLYGRPGDEGRSMYKTNWADDAPELMYDIEITGFHAIPGGEGNLVEYMKEYPLVEEHNTVAYDPSLSWSVGDMLSRRVLREPEGSRADVAAYSYWDDGRWSVTLVRSLDTGNADDKALLEGEVYTIGIGVFDDSSAGRDHHVSLEKTLGIDVDADIKAVKLD